MTYDNNGNVTAYGTSSYTWDYRNRITQAGTGSATSTYGYDYAGNRVLQTTAGVASKYINNLYSITGATTTKHIYAGGTLISTVASPATIALDSVSTSTTVAFDVGPTTKNWTHTVTGSNPVIVLLADIFQDVSGVGTITAASWNGGHLPKQRQPGQAPNQVSCGTW